jgi:TRAP-type C4-dicarboxylate transport system permease small subunit
VRVVESAAGAPTPALPRTPSQSSPASGGGQGGGKRGRQWEGALFLLLLPKIVLTGLFVLAVADMLAGVFLRYVMTRITDFLDIDPVNFFWVEEVGEFSLAWLTLVGAAIGIADRVHFTLRILVHRLPRKAQHVIHVINHLLIAGFGALAAWYGARLAISNSLLSSPALELNLAWLYGAAAVGGTLILVYGIGIALTPPAEHEFDSLGEDPQAVAAGD